MKITLSQDTKRTKDGKSVSYWAARWIDVAGKRRSKSLGRADKLSKREAKKIILQMESDFDRLPGRKNAQRMRLKEYCDLFLTLRNKELSQTAVIGYETTIAYLLDYMGDNRTLDSISPSDAAHFKAALEGGKLANVSKTGREIGAATVSKHMRNCRCMFNYAIENLNALADNPFKRLAKAVKVSSGWHYITPAEFKALMEHATPKFKAMLALCRLAGLRRLEAYYLEWQDVNFDKGRIYICGKPHWQPKDRESRSIPLCPELSAILLEAFQDAPEGEKRVCPESNIMNINRNIKLSIKRAGLKLWTKPLHSLRKSCITDWAERYPIHAVKEWAGHSSIATTQSFYTQVGDGIYDQAATISFWPKLTENLPENEKTETPIE